MTWINQTAAGLIAVLLLASLYLLWIKPNKFPVEDAAVRQSNLPKGFFARPEKDYEAIKEPVFNLQFTPLSVQLPDLRRQLHYYGKNSRPDSKDDNLVLYFSFGVNKVPSPVLPQERYYLSYDKAQKQYAFSADNAPTSLWIEATPHENQAVVKVRIQGDEGQIISEPLSHGSFALAEKEYTRPGGSPWDLGKWRVDGTLLARQKAKWYGIDRFLEKHGGEEFKGYENKQRIDFGEQDEMYSVYVGPEECMIWKDNQWQVLKPSKETLGYPLLCIKKVDDRIMNLELWDANGKSKIVLNLLRATEAWMPQNIMQGFKFVGARTRSQFVFEVNKERMLLRPRDWLVLTDKGWQKLITPKEIDDYVERKIVGPLFVFDGIEKKDDKQVIVGTLFNGARTEKAAIELPLQGAGSLSSGGSNDKDQKAKGVNGSPVKRALGGEQNDKSEVPIPGGGKQ